MRILFRRAAPTGVTLALLSLSPAAAAQVQPAPATTPTPAPTPAPPPTTLPGLETFSLPSSTQTAPSPAPAVVPGPTPSATPTVVAPPPIARTVRATPTPAAPARERAATSAPTSTPTPSPTRASEAPVPAATPTAPAELAPVEPMPTPSPTRVAPPPASTGGGLPFWAIPAILLGLLGAGALIVASRRRRSAEAAPLVEEAPSATPSPPVAPVAVPPPVPEPTPPLPAPVAALDRAPAAPPQFLTPSAPRAWIEVTLAPRRAGVNLITATADVDVVVRNSGALPAQDVRVGTTLLSARAGQEGELGALFAAPIDCPIAPPFALAPGEERHLRTLATLGREAINVLTAGERPMFVPVVAVNARYGSGSGEGQTSQAFVVGVKREGASKLAPFWLDGPNRMQQALDARPQAEGIRR